MGARVNERICFLNQAANRPIIFDDVQNKEMLDPYWLSVEL